MLKAFEVTMRPLGELLTVGVGSEVREGCTYAEAWEWLRHWHPDDGRRVAWVVESDTWGAQAQCCGITDLTMFDAIAEDADAFARYLDVVMDWPKLEFAA